jgi:hypothetical protein
MDLRLESSGAACHSKSKHSLAGEESSCTRYLGSNRPPIALAIAQSRRSRSCNASSAHD